MKTIIYSMLTAFLMLMQATFTFAQSDTINRTDQHNLKQGYWKKVYPNGHTAYEGWFKDNKPIGELKRYREDGSLKATVIYGQAGTYSRVLFYSTNGGKIAEGFYLDKQKDSLWQYYNSASNLIFEEHYTNGTRHGRFKQYYNDGKTYEVVPYVNGKIEGILVQFYPNGLNKTTISFANGTQHGSIKVFYPDGKIRIEGNYDNGLKHGDWKFYSPDGKLTETVKYIRGIPENYNQKLDKENQELEDMLKNIGKIQEPTVENFLENMEAKSF